MRGNRGTVILVGCAAGAALLVAGCGGGKSASPGGGQPSAPQASQPATSSTAPSTGGTTTTAGAGGAAPARGQRCGTAALSGAFTLVPGSAGAGSVVYNIKLTNTTSRSCTLYGHPGLLLLDEHGAALPTHVQWNSKVAATRIMLAPHESASASARFSPNVAGAGDATSGQCQPTATHIKITPPDETTQLIAAVAPATSVCERGALSVSSLVAGATGPGER